MKFARSLFIVSFLYQTFRDVLSSVVIYYFDMKRYRSKLRHGKEKGFKARHKYDKKKRRHGEEKKLSHGKEKRNKARQRKKERHGVEKNNRVTAKKKK